MAPRTLLVATILALLAGLAVVPVAAAATAVKASVRVEASTFQIAPATAVSVPASGTVVDSVGNGYPYSKANALAALARAADLRAFSFETLTFGGEPYVNAIMGQTSWMYAVNGAGFPNIDVGAFSFALLDRDRVVFYQSPTFTPDTMLLQVRVSPTSGLTPGQTATFTVVGDALSKPNSAADAQRFGVDPATVVGPGAFAGQSRARRCTWAAACTSTEPAATRSTARSPSTTCPGGPTACGPRRRPTPT